MQIELVEMTPQMAAELLGGSTMRQRPLNKRRVAALAAAILRGEWKETHQAIALDSTLNIIDGQHRLSAIVKAGVPVKLTLASDVDPATFSVIDTGLPRNIGTILSIEGLPSAHRLGTATRAYMMYREELTFGTPWGSSNAQITNQQILDLLEAGGKLEVMHAAMNWAERIVQALGRFGYRAGLTVFTAIAMEDSPHPDTLANFLEHLQGGHMLPQGSPILALQKWVNHPRTGLNAWTGRERTRAAIITTTKAFNDYVDGGSGKFYKYNPETQPVSVR